MNSKIYAVYIVTNKPNGVLYIGFTNNLKRRILEHKIGIVDGFTKKYVLKKLVYAEQFKYVNNAIAREKQLKGWLRKWKLDLIEKQNPEWKDLYETFFGPMEPERIVREMLETNRLDPESSSG
ncbi:MAG: Excinuclease ABC C subunit domain protein [candidate division TM6 bacterium GW2011_GWF2_36_6]|jgi:putative endonuclease|nr:MAG: Excinuclease ABC C subunit domain protein [candidate division TM6 bacterium GW2011_GWF2_36_6]